MFNDYRRNLRLCAERFGIFVKRGYGVKHVVPGGDVEPWMVELEDCEEPLPVAGVATWKAQDPKTRHHWQSTCQIVAAWNPYCT